MFDNWEKPVSPLGLVRGVLAPEMGYVMSTMSSDGVLPVRDMFDSFICHCDLVSAGRFVNSWDGALQGNLGKQWTTHNTIIARRL